MKRISYKGLKPSSKRASAAGRGSSRKSNTKPELYLRKALWNSGFRYRKNVSDLPGIPDIVFSKPRIVIFCDGEFWHGNNWNIRKQRLKKGTNPDYWIAKIERNMERDKQNTQKLENTGWTVLRFWESEIYNNLDEVVFSIISKLRNRQRP